MAMPEVSVTESPIDNQVVNSDRGAATQGAPGLCFVEQEFCFKGASALDQLVPLLGRQIQFSRINALVQQAGFFEQLAGQCIALQEQLLDLLDAALEPYRLDNFTMNHHSAHVNGCAVCCLKPEGAKRNSP